MSKASDNETLTRLVQSWVGVDQDGWGGAVTQGAFLTKSGQAPVKSSVVIDLTPQDFIDAANMLGASYAQVRAIFEVEASGSGWFTDVRADILALDGPGGFIDGDLVKILFEAHVFDKETGGVHRQKYPNLSSPRWNRALYVGGAAEWRRLHNAMQLDLRAALRSASWGAAQIMGFNHKLAGFDTVEAFVEAMKSGARAQLLAFVSFVKNSGLTAAVRRIDGDPVNSRPFAKGYNGEGYRANNYDGNIAAAFRKWAAR